MRLASESVTPCPTRAHRATCPDGARVPVDEREIHTFRLTAPELILERLLCSRRLRKQHEPRGVAVDAMHDERTPMAMTAEVVLEQRYRPMASGRRAAAARSSIPAGLLTTSSRSSSKRICSCRLEWAGATLRAARPVHPDANDVPFAQAPRCVRDALLDVVEEHLASLERRGDALARPEPIG